ncbi:MAG: hypothetical protein OEY14_18680, partial [Myxococcales bacterium]|nr:hypothetical protein [Myxococcales bacterium]
MRIARLLMLVLAFSASLGASGLSRADVSAHERQREQLTQAAVAGARRAGGIVPLLQLWAQAPQVDPRDTLARLERIAAAPGIDPPREVYIRTLLAQIRRVLGELDEASAQLRALGYLRDFLVVGPFDNEGKRGMARTLPAEAAAAGPFDREARYPGRLRPVGWRTLPSSDLEPGVRLDSSLRPSEEVCALLATTIEVDRARPITLWVGNGGAFRLFFNGEAVLEDEAYRRADPERHVALVGARPGPN